MSSAAEIEKASARGVGIIRELLEEDDSAERREQFSRRLYRSAVSIYRQTILELAIEQGADRSRIHLSAEIRRELRAECDRAAASMLSSHNRDLKDWLRRNRPGVDDANLLANAIEFARRRRQTHARIAAQTLAYTAHADATLSFWQDVGEEPEFDFGGHGDAPPKCEICAALVEGNPHPLATVQEIGTPHPQCRQTWHTATTVEIGSRQALGRTPGGIIGKRPTLIDREGGRAQAADAIRSL